MQLNAMTSSSSVHSVYMLAAFYDCSAFCDLAYFCGVFCLNHEANPNFHRSEPTFKFFLTLFKKEFILISLTVFFCGPNCSSTRAYSLTISGHRENGQRYQCEIFFKQRKREFERGFASMKIWICLMV